MVRLFQLIGLLVVLSVVLTPTQATLGVDMTEDTCAGSSFADFECLTKSGYEFSVIQTSPSTGSHTAKCIGWSHLAGMKWVDIYMSICESPEKDIAESVRQVIYNMDTAAKLRAIYTTLWFDIDQCASKLESTSAACSYINPAIDAALEHNISFGFYSSLEGWSKMMEQDQCASFAKYPLWYANWDDVPNFSDGANNGKWKTTMKQYYDLGSCMIVNVNYNPQTRPDSPDHRMEGSSGSSDDGSTHGGSVTGNSNSNSNTISHILSYITDAADVAADVAEVAVHGREQPQVYEPRRRTHEERIFKDMTVYEKKKPDHTGNGWN